MLKAMQHACSFYWTRYKRRFLYCLLIYFLLIGAGALVRASSPGSTTLVGQSRLIDAQLRSSRLLSPLREAYVGRKVARAIGLTFAVNLVLASFLCITAANMFGLGALVFIVRPFLWGLLLTHSLRLLLFVAPIAILEGIAYVVAFTASIDLMLAMVEPALMNQTRRIDALKRAWSYNLRSYVLVAPILLVAAVVEVVWFIWVAPVMMQR